MRNGSHRLWLCIAAAVAGSLIAGPAASADVHRYKTDMTFGWSNSHHGTAGFHGYVKSPVRKCKAERPVGLFKRRPGADREMATTEADFRRRHHRAFWGLHPPRGTFHNGDPLYAKAKREVLNGGDVCRVGRSMTLTYPDDSR